MDLAKPTAVSPARELELVENHGLVGCILRVTNKQRS
jgi:hypothetical protein